VRILAPLLEMIFRVKSADQAGHFTLALRFTP
jgi:hypothetical protein